MDDEKDYIRFLSLLFAFIVCMVALIFFSNLFMALIGWDGLGLTSFLLVVFYKNRKRLGSGMITALTNRLGDCLLFCSLGLFLFDYHFLLLFTILGLSLTKSAQFPFSSWLPAAMAAPTPVRALVHSSTLVTAGVYVLIRHCSLDRRSLLLVGRFTMLLAGIRARTESDLKKVVALSTLSQLGVMIVSLGASEKSYCFFHMLSHACFKALLFICVGACIHSGYGTQEFRRLNKFRTKIFVSIAFYVANVSLMGFLFTSGFYRKDIILESLYGDTNPSWASAFFLLGVAMTCFYSIKIVVSSFHWSAFSRAPANSLGGFR